MWKTEVPQNLGSSLGYFHKFIEKWNVKKYILFLNHKILKYVHSFSWCVLHAIFEESFKCSNNPNSEYTPKESKISVMKRHYHSNEKCTSLVKMWKYPKCLAMDKWMKKMSFTHTHTEYYLSFWNEGNHAIGITWANTTYMFVFRTLFSI